MSLKIQIEKESYYPGEKIKGVLAINLLKPIKARKVQITFEGKEHSHVERPNSYSLMRPRGFRRYTQIYEEDYYLVNNTITVWEAMNNVLLGPCDLLFPFEFRIPENALPSVITGHGNENGISYEIAAKINKRIARDLYAHCEIHVAQQVFNTYPTEPIERSREDFGGKMNISVYVEKDVYFPGEHIRGKITLRKDPSIKILNVDINVLCTGSFTAEDTTDAFRDVVSTIQLEVDPLIGNFEWPFDFTTPEGGRYSLRGKLIKRLWEVEVQVNLPHKKKKIVDVPLLFVPPKNPAKPQN